MQLTRHQTTAGPRWARDGRWLPAELNLRLLLELPNSAMLDLLRTLPPGEPAAGPLLPPLEPLHEVWASGVTYLRSRDARKAESAVGDVYERVYHAERPELFFKSIGWRVVTHGMPVRVRGDSSWNVPEPELVLLVNRSLEIVGYTAGNDVSSRSIEGENPLYLPQAKVYDGACSLGPALQLAAPSELSALPIGLEIRRDAEVVFSGETSISNMKRGLEELVAYLGRELSLPQGGLLMTGTGVVPPESFTLRPGDTVQVSVGALALHNEVVGASPQPTVA